MASSSDISFVVTLVHGTWARGAAWTQTDSQFCNLLRQELRNHNVASVKFFRIDWSGRNTHRDRRIASICLRKQLLAQLKAMPNASHYVVAHSHGGNVALRAVCGSPILEERIKGIVTMATPFLSFHKIKPTLALMLKALGETLLLIGEFSKWFLEITIIGIVMIWEIRIFFAIGTLVSGGLTILILGGYLGFFSDWWISTQLKSAVIGKILWVSLLVIATMYVVYRGWQNAQQKFTSLIENQTNRILRRYSYFQPEAKLAESRVLVISSRLDEAYAILIGSWWMHRVTGWGVRLGVSAAIALSLVLSAGIGYGVSLAYEALHGVRGSPIDQILMFITLGCLALSIGLTYVLVYLFLKISGRSSPALGFANPADNLLCNVRARSTLSAPVQMTSKRYAIWQLIRDSKGTLFHSRIYSHRPAIADIAVWISSEQNRC